MESILRNLALLYYVVVVVDVDVDVDVVVDVAEEERICSDYVDYDSLVLDFGCWISCMASNL